MPSGDVGIPRPAIHVPRSWSGRTACDVIDQMSIEYVLNCCIWCCRLFVGRNADSFAGIGNLIHLSHETIAGRKTVICVFTVTRDDATIVFGSTFTNPPLDSA